MEKYYTPELEEFHVGFEYEVKYGNKWFLETLYDLITCDSDGALCYHIPTKISLNSFRVKYLDREDIESLGWKYSDCYRDGGTSIFKRENIDLIFYGSNKFQPDNLRIRIPGVFDGDIKNKSELKKLMKQLNIV